MKESVMKNMIVFPLVSAILFLVSCTGNGKTHGTGKRILLDVADTLVERGSFFILEPYSEKGDSLVFSYSSSDSTVLSVRKSGLVIAISAGSARIEVSSNDSTYQPVHVNVDVADAVFETVEIPGGAFLMGSSDGSNPGDADGTGLNATEAEPGRSDDEIQHKVILSGFEIGKYEITNSQFCRFLNSVGADDLGRSGDVQDYRYSIMLRQNNEAGCVWNRTLGIWEPAEGCGDRPAVSVNWYGAHEFAVWAGYSLPTEAQWEFACRAGSSTPFFWGNSNDSASEYAFWGNSVAGIPSEVGQKASNAFGLHDIVGNVSEWCSDWYAPKFGYDTSVEVKDPAGPDFITELKVARGASFISSADELRSAKRMNMKPGTSAVYVGFRIARRL